MPLTKVKSLGTENIGGANRNLVINGAMMISQRATTASFSGSTGGYVSLDRFKTYANGGGALTLSQETDVPTGEGFKNSMKVTVNTNDGSIASGDYYVLQHRIEGNNSSHLMQGTANAQTITISFYVKSSLTGNFGGALNNSASDRSYPFQYTIDSANTWQRITKTITLDTSGTWETGTNTGLQFQWDFGSGTTFQGTANAWASANYHTASSSVQLIGTSSATWFVTGFQIEIGTQASDFEFNSFAKELTSCQRYYEICNVGTFAYHYNDQVSSSDQTYGTVNYKVDKRASPTLTTLTGTVTSYQSQYTFGVSPRYVGGFNNGIFATFSADAEI